MVHALLVVFGLGRVAIGLAPFVAAAGVARLIGFPPEHDSATARLMARWFGVRDAGLGVLAFYAVAHPDLVGPVCLFNAAMDAGDVCAIAVPLARRQGIDRGAIVSAAFAVGGGAGWLVIRALAG